MKTLRCLFILNKTNASPQARLFKCPAQCRRWSVFFFKYPHDMHAVFHCTVRHRTWINSILLHCSKALHRLKSYIVILRNLIKCNVLLDCGILHAVKYCTVWRLPKVGYSGPLKCTKSDTIYIPRVIWSKFKCNKFKN